jgi:ankyrin repeat protein
MTRLLLDRGVDPNVKRNDLWSPLHLVSTNGYLKVAELLDQRGARIDVRMRLGSLLIASLFV